jgi:hypothetical protein
VRQMRNVSGALFEDTAAVTDLAGSVMSAER